MNLFQSNVLKLFIKKEVHIFENKNEKLKSI